jgi:hypothetical protein
MFEIEGSPERRPYSLQCFDRFRGHLFADPVSGDDCYAHNR